MSLTFIPDGYTCDGHVREVRDLHGAVKFKYRPMLPEKTAEVRRVLVTEKPDKANLVLRTVLAEQIVEWDVKDPSGRPVPVGREGVRRMQPALYDKLYMIVAGIEPSDSVGDGEDGGGDESVADQILRGSGGRETQAEADAKN